ncbi:MAG: DUF4272 domain-containing protein [Saprospiraceae bacterium]|nr:DUF4272 domain-containing protein [Saprospiraceae bacterium]
MEEITEKQIRRKKASEKLLAYQGIQINYNLPCIEDDHEVLLRKKREIEDRALALWYVALKGDGVEEEILYPLRKEYNLYTKFSPKELLFAHADAYTPQTSLNFTWRYEALWVMLWALGYVEELAYPSNVCDVDKVVSIIYTKTETHFREETHLISKEEILDEADLIYRYHWACVEARIKGEEIPCGLDAAVVYERHYALNWLIRYGNQDWDNITTDT